MLASLEAHTFPRVSDIRAAGQNYTGAEKNLDSAMRIKRSPRALQCLWCMHVRQSGTQISFASDSECMRVSDPRGDLNPKPSLDSLDPQGDLKLWKDLTHFITEEVLEKAGIPIMGGYTSSNILPGGIDDDAKRDQTSRAVSPYWGHLARTVTYTPIENVRSAVNLKGGSLENYGLLPLILLSCLFLPPSLPPSLSLPYLFAFILFAFAFFHFFISLSLHSIMLEKRIEPLWNFWISNNPIEQCHRTIPGLDPVT